MDFPAQVASGTRRDAARSYPAPASPGSFDMRQALTPSRLTMLMWDQAFLLRHHPGGSFADYPKVLDETLERGYNTVRLDTMPQWIGLDDPDRILHWDDPKKPFLPWDWNCEVEAPAGRWLIDFMEQLRARDLYYTLSCWWSATNGPAFRCAYPENHVQAAEVWAAYLEDWRSRFGFDGLVYVDLQNECPFFIEGYKQRFEQETGHAWDELPRFSDAQVAWLAADLNPAMKLLHRAFPELRFTVSIHGDTRWLDVPLEFDCLDVHFYADADPRWRERTKMHDHFAHMTTSDHWFKDYSDRCTATHRVMAPMLRARQRDKLFAFADWAQRRGMPLTTTESWASWFYIDHPDLDWGWLLEWAGWSVEDALDANMWGWTPHNYGQPQFANWHDVKWHQRLTGRFLNG
ncbi:MAG: cellulase-like family protein [Phycisphaerae bacterium]